MCFQTLSELTPYQQPDPQVLPPGESAEELSRISDPCQGGQYSGDVCEKELNHAESNNTHHRVNTDFNSTKQENIFLSAAEGQRPWNYSSCCLWPKAKDLGITQVVVVYLSVCLAVHPSGSFFVNLSINLFHSLNINI